MSYALKCDACGYVEGKRKFYEVAQMPENLSPIRPLAPTHICIECVGANAAVAAERALVETEGRVTRAEQEMAGRGGFITEQKRR